MPCMATAANNSLRDSLRAVFSAPRRQHGDDLRRMVLYRFWHPVPAVLGAVANVEIVFGDIVVIAFTIPVGVFILEAIARSAHLVPFSVTLLYSVSMSAEYPGHVSGLFIIISCFYG